MGPVEGGVDAVAALFRSPGLGDPGLGGGRVSIVTEAAVRVFFTLVLIPTDKLKLDPIDRSVTFAFAHGACLSAGYGGFIAVCHNSSKQFPLRRVSGPWAIGTSIFR